MRMNRFDRLPRASTIFKVVLLVVAVVVITLASFLIGGNIDWLLPLAGSAEAKSVDQLFRFLAIVGTMITLAIVALLVYSGFAFKRAPDDYSDGPPIEGSLQLEILWTILPIVLVTFLGVYSYDVYLKLIRSNPQTGASHHLGPQSQLREVAQVTDSPELGPKREGQAELTVAVESVQWAWVFTYPQSGGLTTAELHLPVNRPVVLKMTAKDVIHGFWVPEFRLKQDIIPGRTTEIRLLPDRVGEYVLHCTQLCGTYHGAMRATVFVQTAAEFEKWRTTQVAVGGRDAAVATVVDPAPLLTPLRSAQTAQLVKHFQPQPNRGSE
jgi:cytochrome c oxidase subunit 2